MGTVGNTAIKTKLEKDLATTTISNLWLHPFYYSNGTYDVFCYFLREVSPSQIILSVALIKL